MPQVKLEVQLITEAGFGSKIIRMFTWSGFSHVDIVLPDQTLLGARSHADGAKAAGVQIRPPNYGKFTSVKRKFVYVDTPVYNKVLSFAKSQIGKPYDKSGILNFGLHRNWRETGEWFCSELVAAAFETGGIPLVDDSDVPVSRVTPRDIDASPVLTDEILK